MFKETYISVDIETAGPFPGEYAMLALGACLVEDTSSCFYAEIQPDRAAFTEEALSISGLSIERLQEQGQRPEDVMRSFANWIASVTPTGHKPVFVALNAPFDWMFVNDYFYRYLGYNPFGHSALDIKAFFMPIAHASWFTTSFGHIAAFLQQDNKLTHNALDDAQVQAELFRKLDILWRNHDKSKTDFG